MEVSLNANVVDQETGQIAQVLRPSFKSLERQLSKSYGGEIEHLWIDFELNQYHASLRPPRPFRYQKKVAPPALLRGLGLSHYNNVGHYSVRPDFYVLLATPLARVTAYALQLIYQSTSLLFEKQKRLGGFDARIFRASFLAGCKNLGYDFPAADSTS